MDARAEGAHSLQQGSRCFKEHVPIITQMTCFKAERTQVHKGTTSQRQDLSSALDRLFQ